MCERLLDQLEPLLKQQAELNKQIEPLKAELRAYLKDKGVAKVESEAVIARLNSDSVRATLNQSKLKETYSKVYKACLEMKPVAGAFSVKLK